MTAESNDGRQKTGHVELVSELDDPRPLERHDNKPVQRDRVPHEEVRLPDLEITEVEDES